ncbi:probable N-acetyltransferase 16 isoform X1 [Dama dama]|uniref:probable N-acetyltransferase 16 isoform X1 n=1 Tax=Dama dama TaxID=30532 RepID=UPI002A36E134|nr:probable N-acetyltransferase 16 isoform X1 [Dama dama]XP_061008285.1 probable N-acetyltransferase 16 isoform X1 [Dama dama]
MMLGASCDGATSEVSKPEKDVEPDAEPLTQLALGSGPQSSAGQVQRTGSRIRDPGAEESSLGRSRVWPGAPGGWRRSAQRVRRGESFEPRAPLESNPHRQQWPRLQIARESVHGIDAGETAPPERGERVARLLEHFCSQLVRDSTRGIRVARLSRDDQLGPRKLKKFRLITKQNKGGRRARPLLKGPPGFVPSPAVSHRLSFAARSAQWRRP